MSAERLYHRAPVWLQTAAVNAYALRIHFERYGSPFRRLMSTWEVSQWWDEERLRDFQDARLREIIGSAYEKVPFYRERFDEYGIDPRKISGVEDLHQLPVLTRDDVRRSGNALLAQGRNTRTVHGHTSGTTGSPLGIWYDRNTCVANNAADWRQKRWGGMTRADWCGLLLGRVVVPPAQSKPPFWRANYLHKQLWFSSFHMNEENLEAYVREIRRRGLRFLEGYPSTLFILARYMTRKGTTVPLHSVFTSSETLHEVQRDTITEAFECPIYDFYGLAERVIFAGECDQHTGKHTFDEFGVTEIVDREGKPLPPGARGWLVGTSLWNETMPLIRYRTTDMSAWIAGPCACGRGLRRIADVTTKAEDIVVNANGHLISPSVLTHPFKPLDQIVKSQIIQDAIDHLQIKLVTTASFSAEDRDTLASGLRQRVGESMMIDIEIVDDIPPEPSGKFRWVISKVGHECAVPWES